MGWPCKNCPDRYPACHDHCKKYKTEKRKHEAYKKEQSKYTDADTYIFDQMEKSKRSKSPMGGMRRYGK